MSETKESSSAPTNAAASSPATTSKASASVDVVKAKPVETAKELKAKFRLLEKGLANTYDRLAMTEKQIFDLERSYLEETRLYGNVLSGWDKYLDDKSKGILWQRARKHGETVSAAAAAAAAAAEEDQEGGGGGEPPSKRSRTVSTEERLFSLGSVTSPAAAEIIEKDNKKRAQGLKLKGRPKGSRGADACTAGGGGAAPKGTGGSSGGASATKVAKEKKGALSKKEKEDRGNRYVKSVSVRKAFEKEAKKKKRR